MSPLIYRRRANVVLPNDPDLVDILAKNGVDISVAEGDQQGNYVSLLSNLLFPLLAFGGLFFLFNRAQVRARTPIARIAPLNFSLQSPLPWAVEDGG